MNTTRPVNMVFPIQAAIKDAAFCPVCRSFIDMNEFRTALDLKEFEISGMCQACQDNIFW